MSMRKLNDWPRKHDYHNDIDNFSVLFRLIDIIDINFE